MVSDTEGANFLLLGPELGEIVVQFKYGFVVEGFGVKRRVIKLNVMPLEPRCSPASVGQASHTEESKAHVLHHTTCALAVLACIQSHSYLLRGC